MFQSETHLPQLLAADDYTSVAQHERELDRLFRPGWHCVATTDELPRVGDYRTTELLGQPLILWRTAEGIQVFLNVCPHRFSLLSRHACGRFAERIQCQYHGWEFDETGNTRKIPDARSFRPLEQGQLCLTRYRAETCGKLIFVCLDPQAPGLREFLGDGWGVTQELFGERRRPCLSLDYEVEANWKIKVENTLESYHVELVHPKSFSHMPEAAVCEHELQPGWSTFAATEPAPKAWDRFLDWMIHRIAGVPLNLTYTHYIYYPHVMYGRLRMLSWIETCWPVSPSRCRILFRSFCDPGRAGRIREGITYWGIRRYATDFGTVASEEDAAVMPSVQRGMTSDRLPSEGLLSVREERLFHFQAYVREMTGEGVVEGRGTKV